MNEADRRRQEVYKRGGVDVDNRRANRSANSSPMTYAGVAGGSHHIH